VPVTQSNDMPELLRVEDFVLVCRTLDEAEFVARHGRAFLVHYGAVDQMRRPERPQPTQVFSVETPFYSGAPLRALKTDYLVYPIQSTGRSPYPSMITVGRTRNNDIILPDESVSKFHAFFRDGTEGAPGQPAPIVLQDAGSRNGTLLDGQTVPTARAGPPSVVGPGSLVRFGVVQLTFLDAAGLRELVKFLVPEPK
jgi:FHA domain-containing protein